jgi:hypothetical protein
VTKFFYGDKSVFFGDNLWEGKGKTHSLIVKEARENGGTLEFNYSANLTGHGKAEGLNVTLTFTGLKTANSLGAGPTTGQAYFFLKKVTWYQ